MDFAYPYTLNKDVFWFINANTIINVYYKYLNSFLFLILYSELIVFQLISERSPLMSKGKMKLVTNKHIYLNGIRAADWVPYIVLWIIHGFYRSEPQAFDDIFLSSNMFIALRYIVVQMHSTFAGVLRPRNIQTLILQHV